MSRVLLSSSDWKSLKLTVAQLFIKQILVLGTLNHSFNCPGSFNDNERGTISKSIQSVSQSVYVVERRQSKQIPFLYRHSILEEHE